MLRIIVASTSVAGASVEVEQFEQELFEPVGVRGHPIDQQAALVVAEGLSSLHEQFGHPADTGQRRPRIVRDSGQESVLHLLDPSQRFDDVGLLVGVLLEGTLVIRAW